MSHLHIFTQRLISGLKQRPRQKSLSSSSTNTSSQKEFSPEEKNKIKKSKKQKRRRNILTDPFAPPVATKTLLGE